MKYTYNQYNTDIFEGFYNSYLLNDDMISDIEYSDRLEGYLKEDQNYDIDNIEDYKKEVATNTVHFLYESLENHDILKSMELKKVYSPKYYNYETDSLIIDVDIDMKKLEDHCFNLKKDAFNKYLKDNFTSHDGFISYISNNVIDFKEDYKNSTSKDLEINSMIDFYILTQINNSDTNFSDDTSYHTKLYESIYETISNHLTVV